MVYKYCPLCGKELVEKTIDGVKRLACSSSECNYVFWNNPVPVIAAVIEHRNKILLVRNRGWPEDMYGLVTGFLERNESPEEGILREVAEELGLTGESARLIGAYAFFEMNQLLVAYHVVARGDIVLGEEIAEVKAVEPERLKPWAFGTGLALRDWLARKESGR